MYEYQHRQYGPWATMMLVAALGTFAIAAYQVVYHDAGLSEAWPFAAVGATLALTGSLFSYLNVWDGGDRLAVRFGPIPLLGTSIPYDQIESVDRTRTHLWRDGFGVHGFPGICVVFNIWGFGAVRVRLKRRRGITRVKTVLIGTDEPDVLLEFLLKKVAQQPVQPCP